MQFDEQKLLSFSQELWADQLGLHVDPTTAEAANGSDEKTLSSCINVSGPWQGTILLECPESIARHAAAMLFDPDEESSDEDAQDALKELASMIGRKMRTLLPESSKLSRPSILADPDQLLALQELNGLSDLKLTCEGRPVRIALLQKAAEPEAAQAV